VEAGLADLTGSHPGLAEVLDRPWADAARDVSALRAGIGRWFDGTMDRVSGWCRRRIRWILGAVGAVLAVGLNISVLHVAEALGTDPLQRDVASNRRQPWRGLFVQTYTQRAVPDALAARPAAQPPEE
jgi:hypothetical protein